MRWIRTSYEKSTARLLVSSGVQLWPVLAGVHTHTSVFTCVTLIGARTESGDVPTSVMETAGENQYAVHVEWVDPHSQLLRRFHLKFFEVDSTLEIFDTRAKK